MNTLDLERKLLKTDESPYPKKVDTSGGMLEQLTMVDVVRAIGNARNDQTTKADLDTKGRLVKLANKSLRKKKPFRFDDSDRDFLITEGAKFLDPVLYTQLSDVLLGRPTIGEDDDEEEPKTDQPSGEPTT